MTQFNDLSSSNLRDIEQYIPESLKPHEAFQKILDIYLLFHDGHDIFIDNAQRNGTNRYINDEKAVYMTILKRTHQSVTVPPFIDSYIQDAKLHNKTLFETFNNANTTEKINKWIQTNDETFVQAWLHPYDVGFTYTVKSKLPDKFNQDPKSETYMVYDPEFNYWDHITLDSQKELIDINTNQPNIEITFSQEFLEEHHFWENPLFEIQKYIEP